MKIHVRSAQQLRCPYCHDAVAVAEARICATCSSAQHPECDQAHGGCAVCVAHPKLRRRQRRAPRGATGQLQRAFVYACWSLGLFAAMLIGWIVTGVLLATVPEPWAVIPILFSLLTGCGSMVAFFAMAGQLISAGLEGLSAFLDRIRRGPPT